MPVSVFLSISMLWERLWTTSRAKPLHAREKVSEFAVLCPWAEHCEERFKSDCDRSSQPGTLSCYVLQQARPIKMRKLLTQSYLIDM